MFRILTRLTPFRLRVMLISVCLALGFQNCGSTNRSPQLAGTLRTLSGSNNHVCSVQGGSAYCWGLNSNFQLGKETQGNFSGSPVKNLTQLVSVSTGFYHSCGLFSYGSVQCWGSDSHGQLGIELVSQNSFTIPGLDNVVQIAAGGNHSCALTADGRVFCWGSNVYGELGIGSTDDSNFPVDVHLSGIVMIAAGDYTTCAISGAGPTYCWGLNSFGQFGNGGTIESATPVNIGIDNLIAISSGAEHTCALDDTGTLYCWGDNSAGQLGNGTLAASLSPAAVALENVTDFSASSNQTCAVSSMQTYCWGSNFAQSGPNHFSSQNTPLLINVPNAVQVATFGSGACVENSSSQIFCFGDNGQGALGQGFISDMPSPTNSGVAGISKISMQGNSACAITTDSRLLCWGANATANVPPNSPSPIDMGLSNVTLVTVGLSHTCALANQGALYCWGDNFNGAAGQPTTNQLITSPTLVSGVTGVQAIAIGQQHTCVLLQNGTLECWGDNSLGELGDGSGKSSFTPVSVGLSNVTAVSAANAHTCAVSNSNQIYCWGYNAQGQLGNGTFTQSGTPVQAELPAFGQNQSPSFIGVGDDFSCSIIPEDGASGLQPFCWGEDIYGQLVSVGVTSNSNVPVSAQIVTSGLSALALGEAHGCALNGSRISCWGFGIRGQLGSGSFDSGTEEESEIESSSASYVDVASGENSSCAIDQRSNLVCWGDNRFGQLGNGQIGYSLVPVKVSFY